MPDVWAAIPELDPTAQDQLADVMELRGADGQQRALRRDFLAAVPFPDRAEVLDLGCGTGVLTRQLAALQQVAHVIGVDSAPSMLERAEGLAAGLPNVGFQQADARTLPFPGEHFDAVVEDSVLIHLPGVE